MKYTEEELVQIKRNIQMIVDFLTETYVEKMDGINDSIDARYHINGGYYGLYVHGDGRIIFTVGERFTTINRSDRDEVAWACVEMLACWKELKFGLKEKWDARCKKRHLVTWGFEL